REFPPHWRRATGYSLDQFVKDGENFNPERLMAASEGTLGMLLNITMTLVDLPERTALVLLQFDDLVMAMEATNAILEVDPSAVELMDRMLIDLTREQPCYANQIAFIKVEPEGILAVEFYGRTDRELREKCDRLLAHLA